MIMTWLVLLLLLLSAQRSECWEIVKIMISVSINTAAIHYVKMFCHDGDSTICQICPWSFFMALTVDMPTSFVILIGGVYKSLLRDDDPDSEVDLATSYPNSKFIAILPSHLILRVQVDIRRGHNNYWDIFSENLWCWWVFLQYQLSYSQRVRRQCCL